MSRFVPNSFQVPNAFVDEVLNKISDAACKLYLVVCRKTRGWQKEFDSISLSQFEKFTGKSRPTVIKCLRELVKVGLLIELESTDHGNTYKLGDETDLGLMINFPSKEFLLADSMDSASKEFLPVLVKIFNYASKEFLPLLVKNFYTQKTLSKTTNQKEKINKKSESVSGQQKNGQQKEYSENFEKFWTAYPTCKRKSDKSGTAKTFAKHEASFDLDILISILEKQKNDFSWVKQEGEFIPAPSVWLNQKQWENEYWLKNTETQPQANQTSVINLPSKPKGFLGAAQ